MGSATSPVATISIATPPSITTQPVSQSVNAGASASFSVAATGSAPLGYQWRKDGTNIASATNTNYSIATVSANDAGNYTCFVTNSAGNATSSAATLTVISLTPPSITTQPTSQSVNAGTSASFSVAASGSAPLGYQWRKDGTNIASATNTNYSIAAVSANDAGNYTCFVTNSAGNATSSAATLTVISLTPPSITTQPVSQSVNAGASASFSVAATGSAPLGYQWRKDGTNIASATNTNYSIATVSANDAGNYTCFVTNSAGNATSSAANLTVTDATDSDGDGLTDAWESGVGRYQVVSGSFTWPEAKTNAESRGGHLATITSRAEEDLIVQMAAPFSQPSAGYWAGGTDAAIEGQWTWVTGESWGYTGPGWAPDNSGNEDYLSVGITPEAQSQIGWNDAGAGFRGERFSYILERGYPSNPYDDDSDDDGYNDKAESMAGTDPNNPTSVPPDSDGDGLIDLAEKALQVLGFDWQTAQTNLVRTLLDEAYLAGLYTAKHVTSNPMAFGLFNRSQFDNNREAGRLDVTTNPRAYGLHTSDSIMDLRMGGLILQKQGSNAVVSFQVQATRDIATQSFTNHGTPMTNVVSMPEEKGFLRIRVNP